MTNREFAKTDAAFKAACALVGTGKFDENGDEITMTPTKRQASKFRRGMGIAWKTMIAQKGE